MSAEQCSDSASGIELLAPVPGAWSPGTRRPSEGNEDPMDGWRDLMLSPTAQFMGFTPDPGFSHPVPDFPGGVDSLTKTNSEKGAENSTPNLEKMSENQDNSGTCVVNSANAPLVKSGGSIAERRAAKFGFDASKINTSQFKAGGSLVSAAAQSPYILRTPGISPSALLESPMMLPNLQPSPTTGAFPFPHMDSGDGLIKSASPTKNEDRDGDDTSFTFKPHTGSVSIPCYSASQYQGLNSNNFAQTLRFEVDSKNHASAQLQPPNAFEFPSQLPGEATAKNSNISADLAMTKASEFQPSHSFANAVGEVNQSNEGIQGGEDGMKDCPVDVEQKVLNPSGGNGLSDDGYNWRKYGQKQVKGSEFPRSYYKCTHPICPVKKKVEHTHEGHVTEIIYKGAHNHPKPQPSRRSAFGSGPTVGESLEISEGGESYVKADGDLQMGCKDIMVGSYHRPDGLERTSSTSIATEISCDPPTASEGKSMGAPETVGTPELSSTLASNEEEEEGDAAQGSISLIDDDDNEPDLKKRKMEVPLIETALGSRAVREPRVIVQIESEVDILDDGYRWRKYGQKVVKGNPNPRSYYKCTHPGCTVRKHVERASHNLKCVLTTYEGKHNHEVPTSRNSSHAGSGGGGNSGPGLPSQAGLTLPRYAHIAKSEPQDFGAHTNRKFEYNKGFLPPNYLGDFGGGPSSIYQMKFPSLPNHMLYGAFGANPNNCQGPQVPVVPSIPGLSALGPLGYPPPLPNLAVAGYENQVRPLGHTQPIFSAQQLKEGDGNLLRPMHD